MTKRSTSLTTSDWFCGAGGSSEGAKFVGVEIIAAANHWQLAIETHNTNHPATDHYLTNLSQADPRYFPSTNILWASPECTNHSLAKGKRRKNLAQKSMFETGKIDPAEERSRATMWCVPRFAEYHDYEVVIVENVVEIRHWVLWDAWLHAMDLLGYNFQICYFNSMFFHPINGLSDYAPQSRDRIYIVFWKKGNKKPDLDFRPLAWCQTCEADIQAVQSWKNPQKRWGRYGERRQYVYCCPGCYEIVEPYYYAAWNAVDWSIEAPRIGDREKPLRPKTLERIKIGLEKYGNQPLMVPTLHTNGEKPARPVSNPLPTQTARQSLGFVVNLGHAHASGKNHVAGLCDPLPTQTTAGTLAFIVSDRGTLHSHSAVPITDPLPTATTTNIPFVVELFGTGKARGIDRPLGCVTAGGNHYGLATMPQPFIASYYNGSNVVRGVSEALPTCSTVDRHSLITPDKELRVEDCGFRMFKPHEIKDGMGFDPKYILLGNNRDQVRLAGNAVTPPVAEFLYRQCAKTFA